MAEGRVSLELHFGGKFVDGLNKTYVGGDRGMCTVIPGSLPYYDLVGIVEDIPCEKPFTIYHKLWDADFDTGLIALTNDGDVTNMWELHARRTTIDVYIDCVAMASYDVAGVQENEGALIEQCVIETDEGAATGGEEVAGSMSKAIDCSDCSDEFEMDCNAGQTNLGAIGEDEHPSYRNGESDDDDLFSLASFERDMLGKTFESEEEAHALYNSYAKAKGFSIRKSRFLKKKGNGNNRVHTRLWVCSREGKRKEKSNANEKKRASKPLTRVGCDAKLRIRFYGGRYIVVKFSTVHNHEMATPDCVSFLLSHRRLTSGDKAIVKGLLEVGVGTRTVMDYMVNQSRSPRNVGFIKRDVQNFAQSERRLALAQGDAQAVMAYFSARSDSEPYFFNKYELDNERKLGNIFWADSTSRSHYAKFGEVLVFDTTYKKNAYNKPLLVLVGVNNHYLTTIFGWALLCNERTETFIWVLETMLEAMDGKQPISVLTDGDLAMQKAVKRVLPNARHLLCIWHLEQNAQQNCGHIPGFTSAFKNCMDMDTNVSGFKTTWKLMVNKFKVHNNSWVWEKYSTRHMWAEAYLRGQFFAGMRSNQRVEGVNGFIKKLLPKKLKLYKIVGHYECALSNLRYLEVGAESVTENTKPVLITPLRKLERHGAEVYTHNTFKKFQHEVVKAGQLSVNFPFALLEANQKGYQVEKYGDSGILQTVLYNQVDGRIKCCCMMFESFSLPCSHMICVMKYKNLTELPKACVLPRWTRDASMGSEKRNPWHPIPKTLTQHTRYGMLTSSYKLGFHYASQSGEGFAESMNGSLVMASTMKQRLLEKPNDGHEEEVKHEGPSHFGVRDPDVVKAKVNPGGLSSKRKRRNKCRNCGKLGHNIKMCKKDATSTQRVGSNSLVDEPTAPLCSDDKPDENTPIRPTKRPMDPNTPHLLPRRLNLLQMSPCGSDHGLGGTDSVTHKFATTIHS